MRNRFLLAAKAFTAAVLLASAGTLYAQNDDLFTRQKDRELEALLNENIQRVGVSLAPYEFLPGAETPVPKGFKPFYISHYGRHGSRSDSPGEVYDFVLDGFNKAKEEDLLTEEGETALLRIKQVIENHNGMNGRLTYRGQREHREIAIRMYNKYKKVFRGGDRRIRAISSVVPRCIVSMNAFTGALLAQDGSLNITWDAGDAYQRYISSSDPLPVRQAVRDILQDLQDNYPPDVDAFMLRVFKDPIAAADLVGDPQAFMNGVFKMGAICGSFDMDDFLLRLFTPDDIYGYCEYRSMNMYLRQANSVEWGDIRMESAQLLLDDVISKADEVIATGDVQADLRFGHDWPLIALCSRMGIEGIGERRDQISCRNWPGFLYTPFAGNLQMIFYRNKAGDVLVKFYINERETNLIGLDGGPYYDWEEVKRAWAYKPEMGEVEETLQSSCPEVSGLCISPDGAGLLAASDEKGLYYVSMGGETSAFFTEPEMDCEGVAIDPENKDVYFIVEGAQEVWRLAAPAYDKKELVCVMDEFGRRTNLGLEGISWYNDDEFFVANQAHPTVLYRYSLSSGVVEKSFVRSTLEIADLCYDPASGYLWIADSERHTLNVCNTRGEMIHAYPVPFIDNAEGLWVDHENSCIWVGDDTTSKLYKIHFDNL